MLLGQILCLNKVGNAIILEQIGQSYQTRAVDYCHLLAVVQEFQVVSLIMHLRLPMSSIACNNWVTLIFRCKCHLDCC